MSGLPHTSRLDEQAALVALLRERPRGRTWAQITDVVLEQGSAAAAWAELLGDRDALFDLDGRQDDLAEARRDVLDWQRSGLQFWTILDEAYPARVRDIQEAPPFLFARGNAITDDPAVSVVGSREASPRGLKLADTIAATLVDMGVSVVAGLAAGIDTAAHLAALRCGGRTVAIIGTGITRAYPSANKDLQECIAAEGLLLSQFWPDAPPQQQNFPMRNAIMSGYGIATIVVEAGERSGARIQARMAVHHGRPVIFTDLVADSAQWARQLLTQPDVYVARSSADVVDLVTQLIERPAALSEALDQIAV